MMAERSQAGLKENTKRGREEIQEHVKLECKTRMIQ
jgi:hypothetical protein